MAREFTPIHDPDRPYLALNPASDEYKKGHRVEQTRFWREKLEEWDWFPVIERVKQTVGSYKLGSRRGLMEATGVQWAQGLTGPRLWVEEYCFDTAFREVVEAQGLTLTIDVNHAFFVSKRDVG